MNLSCKSAALIPAEKPLPKKEIKEAFFTDPAKLFKKEQATDIMDQLIRYVDQTPKGEDIYVNIYLIDYQPLIKALLEADRRGVHLHILIDQSRAESLSTNKKAYLTFQKSLSQKAELKLIYSTISTSSINHHKHLLFSRIETADAEISNLVFSTSHNFILSGTKKYQDAVAISDVHLYEAFLENFNQMKESADLGFKNWNYLEREIPSLQMTACFFPRRIQGEWDQQDNWMNYMNQIADYKNTHIYLAMSDWVVSRNELTEKLISLRQLGTQISVIAKNKADLQVLEKLQILKELGAHILILDMEKNGYNMHSKYMLIDGNFEGKYQQVVINGTNNFTTNALRNNNECILIIRDSKIFEAYLANFNAIKATFVEN